MVNLHIKGGFDMDIMTGISALAQAMNIVKGLREIEKGFDEAEFKLKIADKAVPKSVAPNLIAI